jgi:transcriptional regulator with XRE-family HTH domain
VRIGEALAEARGQAGLTVAEVSQRTRIRETIISGIEDNEFSACGGDFYARGHIRSIAKAVGADPEPLIAEYDAVHRAPGILSAVSLDELRTPAEPPGRRRWNWTAVLAVALLAAFGFVGYTFAAGSPHAANPRPAATGRGVALAGQSPMPAANVVVVRLTAVRGCRVVFRTPRGRLLLRSRVAAGASNMWSFRQAVDVSLDNPGGVTLTVDGTNPLPPRLASRPVTLILRPGRRAAVAPTPRPTGPVATVRAYIAAINQRRYARAWRLGGQHTGGSYAGFVAGFSTTAGDTLTIVSVSGDVVTARLTARQTDGTVNLYQGTYTVQHGVIIGSDVVQVG